MAMTDADAAIAVASVKRAIERVKAGGMVIMVDDEDRENEGDLVFAAECSTPAHINFMAREARGLICLSLEPAIVDRLKLPMMTDATKHGAIQTTAFTVSIEARDGVTTGISAADRSRTIHVAIDEKTAPSDIVVPGHIFPLKARSGGVLERAGHTEGSIDLARMAGFKGAAVICEIMNDDGTMARMPDLKRFAVQYDIPMVAIADLIQYRLATDSLVRELTRQSVHTASGTFSGVVFESILDGMQHFALVKGDLPGDEVVDVRVHSQRPLIDVFGDPQSSGRFSIDYGIKMLAEAKHGVLVYLCYSQVERSLLADLRELHANDKDEQPKRESVPAERRDLRMHGTGAQIIRTLGVRRMRVHSTSLRTLKGLSGFGLEVVDNVIISDRHENPNAN